MANKHIIVYSHGFGVKKDDRGLFTDIAAALPNVDHVMFDYGRVNEDEKAIQVSPLNQQARQLTEIVGKSISENPNSLIDVIAHSQGCVVAACANLSGVRKVIMLAPPPDLDIDSRLRKYGERPGAIIDLKGVSRIPGSDGYTKLVPSAYWRSLQGPNPLKLYNSLSKKLALTIVIALDDEIIEHFPADERTATLRIKELAADHNFTGEVRKEVVDLIRTDIK